MGLFARRTVNSVGHFFRGLVFRVDHESSSRKKPHDDYICTPNETYFWDNDEATVYIS